MAVLALDHLPPDLFRNAEKLATTKIWTNKLNGHNPISPTVIGGAAAKLELAGFIGG